MKKSNVITMSSLMGSGIVLFSMFLAAPRAEAVAITNGSFETGDLTGWGGTATTDSYGLNPFGTSFGSGMDGTYWMWLAGYERARTLTQTLTGLSAGTTYDVSFIMASEFVNSDELRVSVDGTNPTLFTAPPWNTSGDCSHGGCYWNTWVTQTYSFTATAASELLQFDTLGSGGCFFGASNCLNSAGYDVGLDNVSIAAAGTAVPEPAMLSLLGLGLVGLGFARRRKSN